MAPRRRRKELRDEGPHLRRAAAHAAEALGLLVRDGGQAGPRRLRRRPGGGERGRRHRRPRRPGRRSEEHTSELQSLAYLVCRLLLEKKKYVLSHILLTMHYFL